MYFDNKRVRSECHIAADRWQSIACTCACLTARERLLYSKGQVHYLLLGSTFLAASAIGAGTAEFSAHVSYRWKVEIWSKQLNSWHPQTKTILSALWRPGQRNESMVRPWSEMKKRRWVVSAAEERLWVGWSMRWNSTPWLAPEPPLSANWHTAREITGAPWYRYHNIVSCGYDIVTGGMHGVALCCRHLAQHEACSGTTSDNAYVGTIP